MEGLFRVYGFRVLCRADMLDRDAVLAQTGHNALANQLVVLYQQHPHFRFTLPRTNGHVRPEIRPASANKYALAAL